MAAIAQPLRVKESLANMMTERTTLWPSESSAWLAKNPDLHSSPVQ
jgi:hypothetical protein